MTGRSFGLVRWRLDSLTVLDIDIKARVSTEESFCISAIRELGDNSQLKGDSLVLHCASLLRRILRVTSVRRALSARVRKQNGGYFPVSLCGLARERDKSSFPRKNKPRVFDLESNSQFSHLTKVVVSMQPTKETQLRTPCESPDKEGH